ncbi:hypothetical protein MtrunA17_Chr3g0124661 [Medicago truncatula]|uniref:Uncharacterized protein n=1 Tax=Medicago truncatula TaxID=3880 RepID=A0A396IVI7_MEDTR|nr:hypothetical protein MtrunA17_Chr3g0124661 [Medicago truncatula]
MVGVVLTYKENKIGTTHFSFYNRFNPPAEPVICHTHHPMYPISIMVGDCSVFCHIGC